MATKKAAPPADNENTKPKRAPRAKKTATTVKATKKAEPIKPTRAKKATKEKATEAEKPAKKVVYRSPVNGAVLPEGKRFSAGEEAREKGRKGGKRSAEVRRERKTFQQEFLDLLAVTTKDSNGVDHTQNEIVSMAMLKKAREGDVRAFEAIRDTIGEKQKEQVEVGSIAPQFSTLDMAFSQMQNGGEEH
jgi:hypothetical protein